MSLNTETHISTETSPDFSEVFADAEESVFVITETPEFAEACLQSGLDPIKSTDTPKYWELVAGFALDDINNKRARGESEVNLAAYELVALTPSFLYANTALANHSAKNRDEFHNLKERVSYFNGVIRELGARGARASETMQAMANVASIAGLTDTDTSAYIRQTVRGAQHELVFGQILSYTGHWYEPASTELDLQGVDYTLDFNGVPLHVDVKASLSEVEALGVEKNAFAIKQSRRQGELPTVVMYSLTHDREFHDTFAIDATAAAEKAAVLETLLTQAATEQQAA